MSGQDFYFCNMKTGGALDRTRAARDESAQSRNPLLRGPKRNVVYTHTGATLEMFYLSPDKVVCVCEANSF